MCRIRVIWQSVILIFMVCIVTPSLAITESRSLLPENIEVHVRELSDDRYEGRGAGSEGGRMAADYIAASFAASGLEPIEQQEDPPVAYFQSFTFQALGGETPWQEARTQNVVGILRGAELPDEFIVIGGHYDGQGREGQISLGRNIGGSSATGNTEDEIWNSAIDNATSIGVLLEIARTLSRSGIRPRRSIAFVAYGAEESGLEGSSHFVSEPHPSLGRTVASVNLEQIIGDDPDLFIYSAGYGSSPVFSELLTETLIELPLPRYKPFMPGVLSNTDHYAFYINRQPVITLGTPGGDIVHTPGDEADGLDYTTLGIRAEFIYSYLVRLANADGDFSFTGDLTGLLGALGGPASEAEMADRNHAGSHGYKVTAVVSNSPAAASGLQPNDVIIAHNGTPINDQAFYQGLEDALGDDAVFPARLTVLRDSGPVELTIRSGGPE